MADVRAAAEQVQGQAASGSAVTGNPVLVGGSDGTNARSIKTDTTGVVYDDPTNGRGIKSVTGTISATTDVIAAVASKKLKVHAFSILTNSTTAVTVTFQDNAATNLWTVPMQAISGTYFGANLAVACPAYLFSTVAGNKLTLNLSAAQSVTYSISYTDTDAS